MVVFPNCKINLGLHITGKRADGYHDLHTLFYPLPLKDVLEVISQPGPAGSPIHFTQSGIPIADSPSGNLCLRAWQLLYRDYPQLPPIQMHLHKNIPLGAGLGGGSADAAFALMLLNTKFHLGITQEKLLAYALELGSDCPFFILNKPCLATGRGELLSPVALDLSSYSWLLVHPGIHISTAEAFAQVKPGEPPRSLGDIIRQPATSWKTELFNAFEPGILRTHPVIGSIKAALYATGAVYASLTGSGSSVYGLYPKNKLPKSLGLAQSYRMSFFP